MIVAQPAASLLHADVRCRVASGACCCYSEQCVLPNVCVCGRETHFGAEISSPMKALTERGLSLSFEEIIRAHPLVRSRLRLSARRRPISLMVLCCGRGRSKRAAAALYHSNWRRFGRGQWPLSDALCNELRSFTTAYCSVCVRASVGGARSQNENFLLKKHIFAHFVYHLLCFTALLSRSVSSHRPTVLIAKAPLVALKEIVFFSQPIVYSVRVCKCFSFSSCQSPAERVMSCRHLRHTIKKWDAATQKREQMKDSFFALSSYKVHLSSTVNAARDIELTQSSMLHCQCDVGPCARGTVTGR